MLKCSALRLEQVEPSFGRFKDADDADDEDFEHEFQDFLYHQLL